MTAGDTIIIPESLRDPADVLAELRDANATLADLLRRALPFVAPQGDGSEALDGCRDLADDIERALQGAAPPVGAVTREAAHVRAFPAVSHPSARSGEIAVRRDGRMVTLRIRDGSMEAEVRMSPSLQRHFCEGLEDPRRFDATAGLRLAVSVLGEPYAVVVDVRLRGLSVQLDREDARDLAREIARAQSMSPAGTSLSAPTM